MNFCSDCNILHYFKFWNRFPSHLNLRVERQCEALWGNEAVWKISVKLFAKYCLRLRWRMKSWGTSCGLQFCFTKLPVWKWWLVCFSQQRLFTSCWMILSIMLMSISQVRQLLALIPWWDYRLNLRPLFVWSLPDLADTRGWGWVAQSALCKGLAWGFYL